jgi:hypothetical protein
MEVVAYFHIARIPPWQKHQNNVHSLFAVHGCALRHAMPETPRHDHESKKKNTMQEEVALAT